MPSSSPVPSANETGQVADQPNPLLPHAEDTQPSTVPPDPFERRGAFFSPGARSVVFAPPALLADIVFLFLFLTSCVLVIWVALAELDVTVPLNGEIVNLAPEVGVVTPTAGQLHAWFVTPGSRVQRGEKLGVWQGAVGAPDTPIFAPASGKLKVAQKLVLGQFYDQNTLLGTVLPSQGAQWALQLAIEPENLTDLRPGARLRVLLPSGFIQRSQAPPLEEWVVPAQGTQVLRESGGTSFLLPFPASQMLFSEEKITPGMPVSVELVKGRERLWKRLFVFEP